MNLWCEVLFGAEPGTSHSAGAANKGASQRVLETHARHMLALNLRNRVGYTPNDSRRPRDVANPIHDGTSLHTG